jgi:signal transduction histidine kinase
VIAGTALEALTRRPAAFLRSSWPWRSLGYLLLGIALGAAPVLAVAALITGQAAIGGAPVAAALALLAVALTGLLVARSQRYRLRLVDRTPPEGREAGWREPAYAAVSLLALWWIDLGVVGFALGVPVALALVPLQPDATAFSAVAGPIAAVVLLPAMAYPITAWAGARGAMTRAILVSKDAEVGEIARSRARLVDAFEVDLRRIERDLHDGAQQRLVGLTMTLGLARLDLPPGSPAAEQVGRAHEQAKEALAELRELIRGVHPQVLTDRGLPAAVRDAAGRCPVPVDVDIDLPARPPAAIEVTAYYVVTEALTNIAKHSRATRAAVRARLADGGLVVEVRDDGVGGADPVGGTGLTGLGDRLAVAGGRLALSSPPGGPTLLRVEIPCPASA